MLNNKTQLFDLCLAAPSFEVDLERSHLVFEMVSYLASRKIFPPIQWLKKALEHSLLGQTVIHIFNV